MAPRKAVEVDFENDDFTEEAEAPAPAPEVQEVEEVEVQPAYKVGRPTNTWTLWYGGKTFDLVEGQNTQLPIEVYNYLKKAGNLQATL